MITRPDEYGHNNPDLAFVDSTFVRGGTRAVANLTALYALSSKVDQLAERITRVWVASEAKYYVLTNISSVGSSGGWTAEQTNSNLQQVTDNGATTTNVITAAGFTTAGNLTAGGIISTNQFYAGATNFSNSIFVGWDTTAVYLGYQMGNVLIDIGTGVTNKVRLRNTGGFQIESFTGSGTRMLVADSNGDISVQSIPSAPVTSVFGRTGTVTAQSGDYTTAQVTESGNLYYTDARARAALSFAAGSGAYNSTTGVITIPTDNNQIANSAGYITTISGITAGGELSGTYPNPTLVTSAVTGKLLTGVNVTGGSISASDSILSAFGKLQNQINGLLGGSIFQSTWNASTNSPSLASGVGTKGYYYIVSTAGSTNLDGITDWQVGDWAIFDGTVWRKVDNTDAVSSVNGFTGAVSLTTSNISEGSGLYYTDARARAAISVSGSLSYNSSTGVISYTQPTNISTFTNDSGYVTTSGARAALSAGAGISYNSTTGVISSTITQYTDSLARAALSFAAGSGAYNSSTGVITIPTNTNQLTNGAGFITSSALSSYLPLSGGTLTGALNGTTASFSSSVNANFYSAGGNPIVGWGSTTAQFAPNSYWQSIELITNGVVRQTISNTAATFSVPVTATQFNGSGAGLTGVALLSGATFTGAVSGTTASFGSTVSTPFGLTRSGSNGVYFSMLDGSGNTVFIGSDNGDFRIQTPSGGFTNKLLITNAGAATFSSSVSAASFSASGNISAATFNGSALGSYAYRSSGLAELSGANFTGAVSGTSASFSGRIGADDYDMAGWRILDWTGVVAQIGGINASNWQQLDFFTGGSVKATITNGGNVGIGTTSPSTALHVVGSVTVSSLSGSGNRITFANSSGQLGSMVIGSGLSFDGTTLTATGGSSGTVTGSGTSGIIPLWNSVSDIGNSVLSQTSGNLSATGTFTATSLIRSGGTSSQFLKADGSVDSNTYLTSAVTSATGTTNQIVVSASTGAVTFSLATNVTISGNNTAAGFFESSDARKKTIIEKYAGSGVDTYKYTFNETGLDHYGYIAQEVEKVLPNAVITREDGMKDVRYSEVHTFKIMLLENHIERLEEEIKLLKNAIQ